MRCDNNVVAMAAALRFLPHAAASMQSRDLLGTKLTLSIGSDRYAAARTPTGAHGR